MNDTTNTKHIKLDALWRQTSDQYASAGKCWCVLTYDLSATKLNQFIVVSTAPKLQIGEISTSQKCLLSDHIWSRCDLGLRPFDLKI